MTNPNKLNEQVGLLRRGWIDSYDPETNTLFIKLNNSPITSNNPSHPVPAPHSLFYNNGLFIGATPISGTPVVVGQGSGGQYYYVSSLVENLPLLPDLTDNSNSLIIQSSSTSKISLDTQNNITIGSDADRLHINTFEHYISSNIDNEYSFTQSSRYINGVIKRDTVINTNFDQNTKLENDDYDSFYTTIGLDPSSTPTTLIAGSNKNPPFVENREMIYEFKYDADISDDLTESTLYSANPNIPIPPTLNRRTSRADTLSLTLAAPNYLMETVKGTVVDIFGNILDLNRYPLPVGQGQNTINPNISKDTVKSFLSIKALERKSIAYHFEINARKDLTGLNGQISLPDINSNNDYSKSRSRFFFDVDKEGQFKLNVPASSETGNIALLTRYENYSTFSTDDNGNPNQLTFIDANQDIFQDSFASPMVTPNTSGFSPPTTSRGSIQLVDDTGADAAPLDRITSNISGSPTHIMHGMVYHDILQTCYVHQNNDFISYDYGGTTVPIDISKFTQLSDIVKTQITVSGSNANAGGRSGSLNFDGSLEVNIGANTIDRQSLWLDTAGGMVANIGRDRNGRSAVLGMNGDVYLQIGGYGVTGDSRFQNQINTAKGGVFDIRVMDSGGKCHVIRFDDNGVTIMSHGNMSIFAGQSLTISANQNISIDCETLTLQGRMHLKEFGGSS